MPADVILVLGLSAGILGFALLRGSMPETAGAAIIALALCLDFAVSHWSPEYAGFAIFSTSRFVLDLGEFYLLCSLAWSANRVWPIFSAAAQLVAVGGSLAVFYSEGGMEVAYWAVTQMPLFGQLAALALGTLCHQRRLAIIGPYSDWRASRRFSE